MLDNSCHFVTVLPIELKDYFFKLKIEAKYQESISILKNLFYFLKRSLSFNFFTGSFLVNREYQQAFGQIQLLKAKKK